MEHPSGGVWNENAERGVVAETEMGGVKSVEISISGSMLCQW